MASLLLWLLWLLTILVIVVAVWLVRHNRRNVALTTGRSPPWVRAGFHEPLSPSGRRSIRSDRNPDQDHSSSRRGADDVHVLDGRPNDSGLDRQLAQRYQTSSPRRYDRRVVYKVDYESDRLNAEAIRKRQRQEAAEALEDKDARDRRSSERHRERRYRDDRRAGGNFDLYEFELYGYSGNTFRSRVAPNPRPAPVRYIRVLLCSSIQEKCF